MAEHNQNYFRVLVADDENSTLILFEKILSSEKTNYMLSSEMGDLKNKCYLNNSPDRSLLSFDLVTCRQGDEAVDAVKRSLEEDRPFSVAFLDIRMPPGPDGVWTGEQIRALDSYIEIVMITGYSDVHPREISRRIPPLHKLLYIQKPLHRQEIVQFASALASKWHTEYELRKVHKDLERRVEKRTQEFVKANKKLQAEIDERKLVEKALRESEYALKNSREKLRNLSAYLQSAREQERISIAREIHDEIGQLLTALKMDISFLDKRLPEDQGPLLNKTKSMNQLIDKGVESVQRICHELRPGLLDDFGISAAIEWQIQEFTDRTGIKHGITIAPVDLALAPDLATAIFRIFQEALTNIIRHTNSTMVNISLIQKDDELTLTVADNGKGITRKQISDSKSFGLLGIQERARYHNGDVKITGVRGKGSTVKVRIPLNLGDSFLKRGAFP